MMLSGIRSDVGKALRCVIRGHVRRPLHSIANCNMHVSAAWSTNAHEKEGSQGVWDQKSH